MRATSIILLMLISQIAYSRTGSGMPWESPIEKLVSSLTGPVAAGVSSLAFFCVLVGLAFGQDLNGTIRSLLILVVVVSGLVSITSLMANLFGVSGLIQ